MKVLCLVACTAGLVAARPLAAQARPVTVTAIRGLTFGAVLPGVPQVVSRTDPANSGQFDIRGSSRRQVLLTFILPLTMTGPAGAQMPLAFGSSDAGYSEAQAIGRTRG